MANSRNTAAFAFARAGSLEPNSALLRQRASAALSDVPDGTTFVVLREGATLRHYVVLADDGSAERAAFALARSVAANSQPAELPDLSRARSVAALVNERGSIAGSNSQVGADIQAVVDVASSTLRDGDWVAMSVRRPNRTEVKRNARWLTHRGTYTHHSLEVNAVVISMWAGADTQGSARGILRRVVGALPGFDLRTKTTSYSAARDALAYFIAAAAGAAFALLPVPFAEYGWGLATLAFVLGVATVAGLLPSPTRSLRRALAAGLVPQPPQLLMPPSPPKKAGVDKEGNPVPARDGDYPLHPRSFLVGAATPVTLVAPHAGAESGAAATHARTAPPVLRSPIGPLMGYVDGANPVYLSVADAWAGFMALGEPSSGKSALLQALWGYDAALKSGRLPAPGGRGVQHAMIAFDTKNDSASAEQYCAWSESVGDRAIRIDFSDESSPLGIELFPQQGSAINRARRLTSALKYVFGETSIGPESFDTLTRVFVGAFASTPDVVSQVPGLEAGKSPFYYANILLTSRGDDLGKQLADALRTKADRTGDVDAQEATSMLTSLYDPQRTPAQRQQLVKAPRNKMEQLVAAEHWWSRPRRATWKSLLEKNASVVINFGTTNGYLSDEESSSQVASLMMYTLREEIQRHCIGWFEQRRMVSVYADELKHIAGTNASVVSWLRNDARAFGARGVFATQFPAQLQHEVKSTVMGFGTLVCFAQKDSTVINDVLSELRADGSEWEQADVFNLARYNAIVRTTCEQTGLTPFTVVVPDFRAMRGDEFLHAQGVTVNAIAHPDAAVVDTVPDGQQYGAPLERPAALIVQTEDDLGHDYRLPPAL